MKSSYALARAAALGAFLFMGSALWSQQATTQSSDDQHIPADEITPSEKSNLIRLSTGSKALTQADRSLLEKAAKWYAYRMTWKKYQEREPVDGVTLTTGRSVYDILKAELYPLLVVPDPTKPNFQPNDNQIAFMSKFTEALLPPLKRVLKNARPIARVNAAIVLAKLSESGQESLAPVFLEILNDSEQLEAVKLWALVGLKNTFKGDPFSQIGRDAFVDKSLEAQCVKALEDFVINRKPAFGSDATSGEIDAYRYLRREAIRALGQTRFPALAQRKELVAKPALDLLRIIRKDNIRPEPSPSEQIEAAIGLCNLQMRQYLGYQLEYAVYELGQFLVEYGDLYEAQRNSPTGLVDPWKSNSIRLDQALANLQTEASSHGRSKAVVVIGHARAMLRSIISGVGASQLRELRQYLEKNPTSETTLYQGRSDAVNKKAGG
jgi:hypothetical protein